MKAGKTLIASLSAAALLAGGSSSASASCEGDAFNWCIYHTTKTVKQCHAWAKKKCSLQINPGGGVDSTGIRVKPYLQYNSGLKVNKRGYRR